MSDEFESSFMLSAANNNSQHMSVLLTEHCNVNVYNILISSRRLI